MIPFLVDAASPCLCSRRPWSRTLIWRSVRVCLPSHTLRQACNISEATISRRRPFGFGALPATRKTRMFESGAVAVAPPAGPASSCFFFSFFFFCAPLFSNKNCHCSHRFAARGFRSPLAAKISSAPQWSTHKHAILESYHVNSPLIREINHILRKEIAQPSRSRHKRQMSYKLHLPKYFKVYDVARPALSRTFPAA